MYRLPLSGARRNIVVVLAVVVVGVAAVAVYFTTSPASFKKLSCQIKDTFSGAPKDSSLADAGCQETGADGETYFVSCGGFF